jgi:hypothetical protein
VRASGLQARPPLFNENSSVPPGTIIANPALLVHSKISR